MRSDKIAIAIGIILHELSTYAELIVYSVFLFPFPLSLSPILTIKLILHDYLLISLFNKIYLFIDIADLPCKFHSS